LLRTAVTRLLVRWRMRFATSSFRAFLPTQEAFMANSTAGGATGDRCRAELQI
jgi:hypothetical protein